MSLYVPPHFAPADRTAAARLVHDYPFATLVTAAEPEAHVTHVPLLHVADGEPHGALLGHLARANPHGAWAASHPDAGTVAIFHGPHAYVSPAWYADPAGAVPTWNYAVVHAHGTLEISADPAFTRTIVDAMVSRFEGTRAAPWAPPADRRRQDAMLAAIVGFRLRIRRLDVKLKLSQNRSAEDRARVAAGLAQEGHAEAAATAAWMDAYVRRAPDAGG